ncbi:MAG: hypothetical protein JWM19_99 [Actinomycetia bacterium]|nr:hypothetical protein [Actinomycetes bacterium]
MRSGSLGAARRGVAAMAATLGIAAILSASVTGCSSGSSSAPATQKVLLTSGTYDNVWWGLWAWAEGGKLCMAMGGTAGPNAPNPAPSDPSGGECGFEKVAYQLDYYDSGVGPAGSNYSMGPLPSNATQIKVATHLTLPTAYFPAGDGLPAARYWVEILPPGGKPPMSSEGTYLTTPQPLDASGKPVSFKYF